LSAPTQVQHCSRKKDCAFNGPIRLISSDCRSFPSRASQELKNRDCPNYTHATATCMMHLKIFMFIWGLSTYSRSRGVQFNYICDCAWITSPIKSGVRLSNWSSAGLLIPWPTVLVGFATMYFYAVLRLPSYIHTYIHMYYMHLHMQSHTHDYVHRGFLFLALVINVINPVMRDMTNAH
jgi:hypothetical protein